MWIKFHELPDIFFRNTSAKFCKFCYEIDFKKLNEMYGWVLN